MGFAVEQRMMKFSGMKQAWQVCMNWYLLVVARTTSIFNQTSWAYLTTDVPDDMMSFTKSDIIVLLFVFSFQGQTNSEGEGT